jgi:hypothetical protein
MAVFRAVQILILLCQQNNIKTQISTNDMPRDVVKLTLQMIYRYRMWITWLSSSCIALVLNINGITSLNKFRIVYVKVCKIFVYVYLTPSKIAINYGKLLEIMIMYWLKNQQMGPQTQRKYSQMKTLLFIMQRWCYIFRHLPGHQALHEN